MTESILEPCEIVFACWQTHIPINREVGPKGTNSAYVKIVDGLRTIRRFHQAAHMQAQVYDMPGCHCYSVSTIVFMDADVNIQV